MDTGLKKLWSRRKTKGRDSTHESGLSNLRKSQSTDQDGLSTPNSPGALRSGNKHSPLDRVSRHSTSLSRPGTSGTDSLLSAVNRAADAVARSEQEYQESADHYFKHHVRTKTPRYVDIFSLSSNGMSSPSIYNEDVAKRNLDLTRVALEGSQNGHVDRSKFQEEVAIRNAYPTSPSGNSAGVSPLVYQDGFDNRHSGRLPENGSSLASNNAPVSQRLEGDSLFREQNMQGSTSSHLRQSDRSWEFQELSRQHEMTPLTHQPNSFASTNGHSNHMPSTSHNTTDILAYTFPGLSQSHTARPQPQEPVPTQALRSYQLSAAESSRVRSIERPHRTQSNSARNAGVTNDFQGADYSVRAPSSLSNTSSVKRAIKLPNRTILDLTGDDSDIFSDVNPDESTNSSSPVVEHAKLDTMRRIPGSAVIGPTTDDRTTVSSSSRTKPTSTISDELHSAASEVPPSRSLRDHVSERLLSNARPWNPRFASAFSAVNTIATSSPRASVVLGAPAPTSNGPVTEQQTQIQRATPGPHRMAEQQIRASQEITENEDLVQKQAEATCVPNERTSGLNSEVVDIGSDDTPQETQKAVANQDGFQATQSTPSHLRESTDTPAIQPHTHAASEQLHPDHAVAKPRAPGVITRDFADMATKSTLSSVPEGTESDGNTRSRRPGQLADHRRVHSHDPSHGRQYQAGRQVSIRPPIFESSINEEELARKQAEARAALIRLQESLNENFLEVSAPAPAPVIRPSSRTGGSQRTSSSRDSKPVAPSSILAQVRTNSPAPPEIRVEADNADKVVDGVEPEASYHNLATIPHADRTGAASSDKPPTVVSPRDKEREDRKGKQRADADFDSDGPGPPILTDEAGLNQSALPLPSPSLPLPQSFASNQTHHPNARQQQQQQPPPSPGEVSLSSFPIPVSSPRQSRPASNSIADATGPASQAGDQQQQQQQQNATTSLHSRQGSGVGSAGVRRQSSQRSQASSASAFSIPYHMIPGRSSSMRDRSVAEE